MGKPEYQLDFVKALGLTIQLLLSKCFLVYSIKRYLLKKSFSLSTFLFNAQLKKIFSLFRCYVCILKNKYEKGEDTDMKIDYQYFSQLEIQIAVEARDLGEIHDICQNFI